MAKKYDLIIKNGQCVLPDANNKAQEPKPCDIGIKAGKISALGSDLVAEDAEEVFDAGGLVVLPGLIDSQVHFREPGAPHKEDLDSGTKSALLGGITAVFEMPNTNPATITINDLNDKIERAKNRAWTHIAFYIGGCAENADLLPDIVGQPGCIGIKVFLGSSTGNLLLTDYEVLEQIMRTTNCPMSFHSEDENLLNERKKLVEENPGDVSMHPEWRNVETALQSTRNLVELAEACKRKIHVLHISTKEEMQFLKDHKDYVTVEVLPQHLTLEAPDCYNEIGSFAQMNPPIRTKDHKEGLWEGLNNGTVDVMGSDHAPHTKEEKAKEYPKSPSGMPGVQTIFPVMLHHMNAGRISLTKIVELLAHNPAKIFGLKNKGTITIGNDADITIMDPNLEKTLKHEDMASRTGWTPFNGMKIKGYPCAVYLKGQLAMQDGQVIDQPKGEVFP